MVVYVAPDMLVIFVEGKHDISRHNTSDPSLMVENNIPDKINVSNPYTYSLLNTAAYTMQQYSHRDVQLAHKAYSLYSNTGYLSHNIYIYLLDKNYFRTTY